MRYLAARSAREAAEALSAETGVTRILAGGTDVLVQLKSGIVEPDLIVDIKRIPGIAEIVPEAGGFRIGAAVPNAVLGEHAGVVALWPGVVEGANLIGSTQVQGRCTMAGNLCNGSPAGDAVPGLVAANAIARLEGPTGTRECPVAEIPAGPGRTTLKKGEVITSILLPARPERAGDAFRQAAHRDGYRRGLGRGLAGTWHRRHGRGRPGRARRGGANRRRRRVRGRGAHRLPA